MPWLIVTLLVLGLAVGIVGGYMWWRRRQAPMIPSGDEWHTDPFAVTGAVDLDEQSWKSVPDRVTPAGQFQRPVAQSMTDWDAHQDREH